ncbi:MAG TPA: hypothetical protein VGO87_08755, partial [Acidimicrobiia bacterium]
MVETDSRQAGDVAGFESVRAEFDRGFTVWRHGIAAQFERYGYAPARADALAVLFMSALEGALIIARAAPIFKAPSVVCPARGPRRTRRSSCRT